MKRLYLLTFILCLFRLGAVAQVETSVYISIGGEGIYCNIYKDKNTASVCRGTTPYTYKKDVTIPESITYKENQYVVTGIADDAFTDSEQLTSVTLPKTIKSIGSQAFKNCIALTSITIPESVKTIGEKAFYECSALKSISIPDGVKSIGDRTFYYCSALTSITIPNSVTSIGTNAFYGCSGLTSITIPNSVTSIGNYAFNGCSGLTSITIPNSVTSIGSSAFSGCNGLTSITIPNSVTSMDKWLFSGCRNLKDIFMKPVTPPTVPEDLLLGCAILTTIYVPKGSAEVYNTTPWNNYTIVEKNITTCVDGVYYSLNGYTRSAEIINSPDLYSGNITIPATITFEGLTYDVNSIAMDAFAGCNELTDLTLGTASPPAADPSIFNDCTNLTSIHIPDGALAAYNCEPWINYRLFEAVWSRMIKLIPDIEKYLNGEVETSAIIPSGELIRKANELLDEARADVESLTYDVNTVGRLQELRDYLATGDFAGAENVDISFNRKSNHTGWQSLYVPFDIAYDDIADDFVVAELNNFHQYDDDSDGTFDRTELEVLLLKSGDVIAHHTPYVIRAKETGTHTISLPGATLYASANNTLDCSSTKIRYVFHGTYQGVSGADMYANNYYAMSNGSLCKANSINADLSAFRWYLSMEDRNSTLSKMPAKIKIVCIDDDTTTDISEVDVKSTDENAPIYDLNGRFVGRKAQLNNLPKGVYFINGKKVLR